MKYTLLIDQYISYQQCFQKSKGANSSSKISDHLSNSEWLYIVKRAKWHFLEREVCREETASAPVSTKCVSWDAFQTWLRKLKTNDMIIPEQLQQQASRASISAKRTSCACFNSFPFRKNPNNVYFATNLRKMKQ